RGGDADDGAAAPGQHAGQERLDGAVDRLDVEIEGEVPVLLGAVEHGAVVHEAGGIEQDIDGAEPLGLRLDGGGIARIELHALRHARRLQVGEGYLVDVAGDHAGALARERDRRGPADTRTRCRAEGELPFQTIGHVLLPGFRYSVSGP